MSKYTDNANIFNLGVDILGVNRYDNKTINVQLGDVTSYDDVTTDEAEYWQQPGFLSIPANPIKEDSACQAISIINSDYQMIIATRDIRANVLHDDLGPGEVQIFAGGPENKGICKITLNNDSKDNQSITLTVKDTKIIVSSDGKVTIDCNKIDIAHATDFAALSAKVDANFNMVKSALSAAASAAMPNDGGKAAFGAAISAFNPNPTAASDVKIS